MSDASKPLIYSRISLVMAELEAIGKDRSNIQQNYKFRGVDDIYNAVHGLLAKHKVFTVPTVLSSTREERQSKNGGALIYTTLRIKYTLFTEDGSNVDAVVEGEGMDSGDKSSNKAMSAAHKYLFLQLLAIPTEDDKDSEYESPEVLPKPKAMTPVKPSVVFPSPGGRDKNLIPATDKQRAFVWALLKSKMKFDDEQARLFIVEETGKDKSLDLSAADIDKISVAVEREIKIKNQAVQGDAFENF